jgi:hypothetical protein
MSVVKASRCPYMRVKPFFSCVYPTLIVHLNPHLKARGGQVEDSVPAVLQQCNSSVTTV